MKSLARPDGFATRWAGKLGDFFCLSIVFAICCLPLITLIPACIALYGSAARCIHGNQPHPCKHFFSTLRKEILRGMLLTLLWAALAVLLFFGYGIISTMEGTLASIYATLYLGTLLIPAAILIWLIPLQEHFSYGFWELHKAALTFSITHLPTTAVILLLLFATAILLFAAPPLAVLLPAITATIQSHFIEKILSQYTPEPE